MAPTYAHKAEQRSNMINAILDALIYLVVALRCWNQKGNKTAAEKAFAETVLESWNGEGKPAVSTVVTLLQSLRERCLTIGNEYHEAASAKYPEAGSQDSTDMTAPGPAPIVYDPYNIINDESKDIGSLVSEGEMVTRYPRQ